MPTESVNLQFGENTKEKENSERDSSLQFCVEQDICSVSKKGSKIQVWQR